MLSQFLNAARHIPPLRLASSTLRRHQQQQQPPPPQQLWLVCCGFASIVTTNTTTTTASHSDTVLEYLTEKFHAIHSKKVVLDGNSLNIGALVAVARYGVPVEIAETARGKCKESVDCLQRVLAEGKTVYGVNSGYGGSANVYSSDYELMQKELIRFLNSGFGHWLPEQASRAATLCRINSNLKGYSALRIDVIERLVEFLNAGMSARMPSRGSITASGDLVPLSYIAGFVQGRKNVQVYHKGEIISCAEAHHRLGKEPLVLQAKEGLSVVNGTSVAAGCAATVLYDCSMLLKWAQITSAMSTEILSGTNLQFHRAIHDVARPHPGQIEVAANLRALLQGSALCANELEHDMSGFKDGKLRQDRYSIRTSPQVLGPVAEALASAGRTMNIELNAATDNPLVFPEINRVLNGGNFMGNAIALTMDQVRLSVQLMGRLCLAQFQKMIDSNFNNGLPANLAVGDPHTNFGFKGADIAMASYQSELQHISNPMSNTILSAELNNQDVNSLALISVRHTVTAADIYTMMVASHLVALCTAAELRAVARAYRSLLEDVYKTVIRKYLGPYLVESTSPTHLDELIVQALRSLNTDEFKLVYMESNRIEASRNVFMDILMHLPFVHLPADLPKILVKMREHTSQVLSAEAPRVRDRVLSPRRQDDSFLRAPDLLAPKTKEVYNWVRDRAPQLKDGEDLGQSFERVYRAIKGGQADQLMLSVFGDRS
eukprot:gnl/Spiro4/15998_TR8606_c0_g1_i1.p1 gnl/Spiro4/15998_TR8606_c0_g1~~gnl/Spiro4/15998_TR8606_c0_g1_i1.p1  ORF type:complete len:718 (+),score=133.37 gnl/Spiro4/15998_TR8606_c0_g1_i1:106-2259(+)